MITKSATEPYTSIPKPVRHCLQNYCGKYRCNEHGVEEETDRAECDIDGAVEVDVLPLLHCQCHLLSCPLPSESHFADTTLPLALWQGTQGLLNYAMLTV